jgi:RNA polymerase sigma-70 factor, ECF subfamily
MGLDSQIPRVDEEIVILLQKEDSRAIDIIYDKYGEALYGILCKILNDEVQAQDALQTTLVKIWKNGKSYDSSKGRLFTWMLNICRNTGIDMLRSKENKTKSKNQSIDNLVNTIDLSSNLSINIDSIGIKDIIEKLPEDQKKLITLMYFKGYTQQEIADYIPMPLGTVKTKIRAALISLRNIFNS